RITRDSAGIALLPFPNGRAAEYPFRLTSSGPGMALFEAPEHDFPKRIRYSLSQDGTMTARIDGGEGDARVQEWSMKQVGCHDDTSVGVSRSPGESVPGLVVPGIATHGVTAANGRAYRLYVHLPPGYSESDSMSYPVLYLTDAEMEVMAMYVGIANFLRITQRIRDVILVGIADGDVGVHGDLRRLDYTPTRRPGDSTTSGGADEFLDFVQAVAMPLIDDVYRTEASDRGLWGYSFGGA